MSSDFCLIGLWTRTKTAPFIFLKEIYKTTGFLPSFETMRGEGEAMKKRVYSEGDDDTVIGDRASRVRARRER